MSHKSRRSLQKKTGLSIVGSDVKSLFLSLRNIETARLARKAILDSKIEFSNWDFVKAMRYIYLVGGRELVSRAGLERLCPKWLGDREDMAAVGGTKSKDPTNWRDSQRSPVKLKEKMIIAKVVEIAVNLAMSTHVYTFSGRYFLHCDGSPIGLRSTASLAALVIKLWDMAWLRWETAKYWISLGSSGMWMTSAVSYAICRKAGNGMVLALNIGKSGKRQTL